ncbi:MAG: bifunctional UDP-N-acetylglucosamine diphosphorylase/glucosamine-1-phosphate N-acetyltransferase GlmU [Candidatus Nanopelagicales bacterium]
MSQLDLAIVLAAGEGKRMRSKHPKVLHEICGAPLISHVLEAIRALETKKNLVVLGDKREAVTNWLAQNQNQVETVVQEEQLGTGHAVKVALESQKQKTGKVLIVPADMPLITPEDLSNLFSAAQDTAGAVLIAEVLNPSGYGRVKAQDSKVLAIIEDKDADEETLRINEINTGIYIFDISLLSEALKELKPENQQKEFYLTDVVEILNKQGHSIASAKCLHAESALGVNDRQQLAEASLIMQKRINSFWLSSGVSMRNPETVFIDRTASLSSDCFLDNNTFVLGKSQVAEGVSLGPDVTLVDCKIGENAKIISSTLIEAEVGEAAAVGPYTYLRPGAKLAKGSKVGAYVEVKNSSIGEGAKVPHLSYIGDGIVGKESNIGAGTIFANYDGEEKHQTVVGEFVKIGSDNVLVAPVTIGDGAYTAAGSVIVEDVEPGAMGVARGKQKNVLGWVKRKRPNSKAAKAAERAQNHDPDK